jgi:hypothetical protein
MRKGSGKAFASWVILKERTFWQQVYEGKSILEISKLAGQSDPVETCFDLIVEEGAFVPAFTTLRPRAM